MSSCGHTQQAAVNSHGNRFSYDGSEHVALLRDWTSVSPASAGL